MRTEPLPSPDLVPTLTEVLEVPDLGEVPAPAPRTPHSAPVIAGWPPGFTTPHRDAPAPSIEAGRVTAAERLSAEVAGDLMRLLEPIVQEMVREAVRREMGSR